MSRTQKFRAFTKPGVIHPLGAVSAPSQANCVKLGFYQGTAVAARGGNGDGYWLPGLAGKRQKR